MYYKQNKPLPSYTLEEAKRKLEQYCVYQERCHKEVSNKLIEMKMIPSAVDVVIGHLIEHNFLNETRFAQAFVRGKFSIKKWGRNRITRELKLRNISSYNIKKGLSEITNDAYLETFEVLSKKKSESIGVMPAQKQRKKLADYLLYRGWESSMVYAKVVELFPY